MMPPLSRLIPLFLSGVGLACAASLLGYASGVVALMAPLREAQVASPTYAFPAAPDKSAASSAGWQN